jgi:hypothetical protein
MALVLKDRVRESTVTSGTGTLTLDGAVGGFQGFSVIGDGNTTYYAIVDVTTGAWEVGVGTYTVSGQTLSRDSVLESSNSGNLVNFLSNIKDVFCTYPAEQAVTLNDIQTLTNKTLTSPTISGGTINNASVGATTASTGAFTTLSSNSTTTLNGTTIPASKTLVDTDTAQTLTNKTLTSPSITTPTGLVKGDVGLGNVDNTSDATKNAATATLTNKTISGANNTLSDIGNASLTNSSINFTYSGGVTGSASAALGGTNALSLSNVPNASLQNSSITFGSTAQALGSTVSALNGVSIGASSASTGAFTNLAYTGTLTGGTGVINIGSGQLYKDASGNVGIGTSSPNTGLVPGLVIGNGTDNKGITLFGTSTTQQNIAFTDTASDQQGLIQYDHGNNSMRVFTSSTERLRIDSAGNVGIGTSSPGARLHVQGNEIVVDNGANGRLTFATNDSSANRILSTTQSFGAYRPLEYFATEHRFSNGTTERARIDSSGNLLVGTTSRFSDERLTVDQSSAGTGILTRLSGGPYNSTAFALIAGVDGTTTRFYIPSNGGLYNYSANNVNLSDARTKTDIQDAGNYLEKICAIPVRTFRYKDQKDELLNLGVIAQEVEAVAPELVDIEGFGDTPDDGVPLKGIYQTDLTFAMMKAIQEQQAIINDLKARLDAANL